jgi:hypothetical protein
MSHPADHLSVSGRDTPRETGPPVAHDVRVWGGLGPAHGPVMIGCQPCDWHAYVEGGHKLEDLDRLAVMHATGKAP